ncbi:pentapeptide repeat-containing protein [Plesiomonas sp.]|uniref:pentapeptide repeat-containing protein n=1 Tax=Plesiomonas sp. TaxID=2486279 RepID=UPI003F34CFE4
MDGISNSPTRISNAIRVAVSGIDSNEARKIASTPKGIIEFLVNLFSFGKVSRDLGKQYDKLLHDFSKKMISSMADVHISAQFQGELQYNFEKCSITIYSSDNFVELTVASLDSELRESARFPAENFQRAVNFFRMRSLARAEFSTDIFNKNGEVNLKNLNLSNIDFSWLTLDKVDLSGSDFENSTLNDVKIFNSLLHDINVNNANINDLEVYRSNVRGVDFSVAKIGPYAVNMHSCLLGDGIFINKKEPNSVLMHSTLYYDNNLMLRPNYKNPPNEHSVIPAQVNVIPAQVRMILSKDSVIPSKDNSPTFSNFDDLGTQTLDELTPPEPQALPIQSVHANFDDLGTQKLPPEPPALPIQLVHVNFVDGNNGRKQRSDKPENPQQGLSLQEELLKVIGSRRVAMNGSADADADTETKPEIKPKPKPKPKLDGFAGILDRRISAPDANSIQTKQTERPLSIHHSEADWDS